MYSISFHPEALKEYAAASIWYEERQEYLGARFEEVIEDKIKKIIDNPLTFSESKKPYREASTNIFPFLIVYKINHRKKEIYISAIHHTKKHPRGKYRKQNDVH